MAEHDIQRLLAFADTLADAARAAILPYFRTRVAVDDKQSGGKFDPVTAADRASEQAMRALIEREFPEHGILGEEFGEKAGAGGYRWILDPIDGTRAFISGLPTWGVLIGLYYEGAPLLGVMDQPYTEERFRGAPGLANMTTRGGTQTIAARQCVRLGDATLSSTDANLFAGAEADAFARIHTQAKLTRYGYDCYAYSILAAGHIDCVIESGLKSYDVAALIPIVTNAGGGFCSWSGGDASQGGQVLAYGDARVRDEVLKLLAPAAR